MKNQEGFSPLANFASRLRQARKRAGLNQTAFATLGGVGLGSQSRYEKGETEPGVAYLAGLAEAGNDVHWLLTGHHSPDALDATSSAIVTAVRLLDPAQQQLLLAFLSSLNATATVDDPRSAFEAG